MRRIVAYAGRGIGGGLEVRIDPENGILHGAQQVPSPNFDARPEGVAPDLIVVHGISLPPGEFGGPWIDKLFTNTLPPDAHPYFAGAASRRVSAHLCIRRNGEITQYVPFHGRAWHAGPSSYEGRNACNDFSIGIELEGTDTVPYDDRQYRALADVIAALCAAYPTLSPTRLAGHSDIAPVRKTDPGPVFDWPRARRMIANALAGADRT
jgi:N-acetyl-anhydromuramoyl-L-alanine amidase